MTKSSNYCWKLKRADGWCESVLHNSEWTSELLNRNL